MTAFLLIVYELSIAKGLPPDDFTKSPNDIYKVSPLVGSVSTLSVILWSTAAAFCFMGAILITSHSRMRWFLLTAGGFTALLTLDDAFAFHRIWVPKYLHIPEKAVYIFYLLFFVAFLFYFLKDILNNTDFPILAASLLCMVVSIAFDEIFEHVFPNDYFEDSAKFLGIIFWLAYFSRTAIYQVRESLRSTISGQGSD